MNRLLLILALVASSSASHICLETSCSSFNVEADIVLVVDASNAYDASTFEQIRSFLLSFVTSLTVSPLDSQVALYAYGSSAQTVASLTDGSSLGSIQSKINTTLKYQGSSERNLFQALSKVQAEVSAMSGLRSPDYKKVLIVMSGDSWTGNTVIGSSLLTQLQQKFNVVLSVGFGAKALANLNSQLPQLTTASMNTFFAATPDQLTYVSAWMATLSCPNVQFSTVAPPPTTVPTQSPSVSCPLASLSYDVYLIVDVSNKASAADFAAMKTAIHNFAAPFAFGNLGSNFALVTTGIDSQLFYTNFHNGQARSDILNAIDSLLQDDVPGQTLNLALNAIQGYLGQPTSASNKVLAYFTSTTAWDVSPIATMSSLKTKYSLSPMAVQWSASAGTSDLTNLVGGANCVNTVSNKATAATWLQNKMCSKVFC
uniref:VWFA domain-containing protein n=1 Tax=Caenorhabditis tropicalis TaxID=1561998 RepID=A0A1I7UBI5_9PELO